MEKGIVKILVKPPEIIQRDNKDMWWLKPGRVHSTVSPPWLK